jgi:hypothetical protein
MKISKDGKRMAYTLEDKPGSEQYTAYVITVPGGEITPLKMDS